MTEQQKEDARLMDEILKALLPGEKDRSTLAKQVGLSLGNFISICEQINGHRPSTIDLNKYIGGPPIAGIRSQSIETTRGFLLKGGFTKQFEMEELEKEERNTQKVWQRKLEVSQYESNIASAKAYKTSRRANLIAIIAATVTALGIIYQIIQYYYPGK